MADKSIPHFHNTRGVRVIEVGAKEFMCIGALPPFDHPHIFIDMGDDKEAVCSYCSTLYRYRGDLATTACIPEDSLWNDHATVAAVG
ncbi:MULTISPECIES: zinc-finger domain-containing protein [unclassified Chelatococcus]|uniref:zinc-finger domain-containing protein n=1 Tax=unclassified Chelatococcus TaxID=2638111 RepID=UPI001BCC752C|nr:MULTISPECIES: zinc-finger domain-containing protein [unclassified Chelatococcus]MBS7698107.1 zinc-finger domain-containing protein [Chelatococcus sp. YT9]MBX3556575.1 zinc-finger domain-containing protein [Chelatococcus sp.]